MLKVSGKKHELSRVLSSQLNEQRQRLEKFYFSAKKSLKPATVHDLRIASRRLIAALEIFEELESPVRIKKARNELKKLLHGLRNLRDFQVEEKRICAAQIPDAAAKGFLTRLKKDEKKEKREAKRVLKAFRCKLVIGEVEHLIRYLDEMRRIEPHFEQTIQTLAAHHLKCRFEDFAQESKNLPKRAPPPLALHSVRIRFKHFRYALELIGSDPNEQSAIQHFQSLLGDIQDLQVLLTSLAEFSSRKLDPYARKVATEQKRLIMKFQRTCPTVLTEIRKTFRTVFAAVLIGVFGASFAHADVHRFPAQESAVRDDVARINPSIHFERIAQGAQNTVEIDCLQDGTFDLKVSAVDPEWSSTLYYGIQKMGYLFPHPRIQITPSLDRMRSVCGQTFVWRPRFAERGFHLHTEHPNEWVRGFLMGDRPIAEDTIRWLARNGQNLINIVLLRTVPDANLSRNLQVFNFAHSLGILTGVDAALALEQQHAYKLVKGGWIEAALGYPFRNTDQEIRESIDKLAAEIPFDFLTTELGTSEFTSTNFKQTIEWMHVLDEETVRLGKQVFYKIHVSSNQVDPVYGNFNFLPRLAAPTSGILPHTVMFYGMTDDYAPVYGRTDFSDIKQFAEEEVSKRPVWYFPETSYWVAMDIDVPLFLTDFLVTRSKDMDWAEDAGLPGHLEFTSGQELGYWLMDWTVALLNNSEYRGDPMIGLKLLGEDEKVWQPILDFQTRYIKGDKANPGIYRMLIAENVSDDMEFLHLETHARTLLGTLAKHPDLAKAEAETLAQVEANEPSLDGVRNPELKAMLQVTWMRITHARLIREAIAAAPGSVERGTKIAEASALRLKAQALVQGVISNGGDRYPEALNFSRNSHNPTSYTFGYLWPAASLHFWDREEQMVLRGEYDAFFMNIYNLGKIVL